MQDFQPRIAGSIVAFLFIFLSGFWLRRGGKPYSVLFLTAHKLLSILALVLLAVTLWQAHQAEALGIAELAAGIVAGSLFVDGIVTGGLLSATRPMPPVVLTLHRVTAASILVATAVTLLLLTG
jgi:hypothetical protein